MTSDPLQLPGFGLPVNGKGPYECFPNAIMDWAGFPATVRERTMVGLMDSITDKPEWDRKIFDKGIYQKWRREAMDSDMDVSEKMLDWIIAELQDKARSYQQDGLISTLDLDATIVKSDTAIPRHLNQALQAACKPLEDVPSRFKDWHPGSNEKVLDLVHPSLFPLVYGRTKIIPKGRIGLTDCIDYIGKGEATKVPDDSEIEVKSYSGYYGGGQRLCSVNFQWLPCQINFAGSEAVSITSYINNLHPVNYSSLYNVLEACIAKAIPLWNRTLSSIEKPGKQRIEMNMTKYTFPQGEELPADDNNDAGETKYDRLVRENSWLKSTRVLVQPEPKKYKSTKQPTNVNLRKQFQKYGLQVIIKLANIELSPEKPDYDGGSWHIEGQLNERICASALYYYDCENITESFLAFRQRVDDDNFEMKQYEQDDYEGAEQIYGIEQEGPKVQEIGRVSTRQGRLLAFPNVLQHRVSPFRLRDPTLPGHRKILALFLVDPHIPIIPTANVPPQQKDWWIEKLAEERSLSMLPQELADQVVDEVKDGVMTLEEAKEIRLRLMEERKAAVVELDKEMQKLTFSFCEH